MLEAEIEIIPPYNFELSLRFAKGCRFETEGELDDDRLLRLLRIDGTPVLIKISVNKEIERPVASVSWSLPEGGRIPRKKITDFCGRLICADLDLSSFYSLAAKSGRLKEVVGRFRGLKPILTPSIFESAAWAIMGQQVNLKFASTLRIRMVEKYGKRIQADGHLYFLFPEPGEVSRASVSELKELQFSTRKAEYLLDLSQGIANGRYPLESLSQLNYGEALSELTAIRGLGVWSANYILMRGAGHLDCLPLGDSGLHRAVQRLYRLKEAPDNRKVEKLAAKFSPYRSLYTLYLWYTLAQEASVT